MTAEKFSDALAQLRTDLTQRMQHFLDVNSDPYPLSRATALEASVWPLIAAAVSAARTDERERSEHAGYLRGLHDAWHHTHIRRFDKDGGPSREGSPHAVDTYYNGVHSSGYVIGDLWRAAGRTDPIGGSCYDEFPVTRLPPEAFDV